jgi:hypothetical protein
MPENVAAKKADVEKIKVYEAKWSKPLMAAGWNVLPSVILCVSLTSAPSSHRPSNPLAASVKAPVIA